MPDAKYKGMPTLKHRYIPVYIFLPPQSLHLQRSHIHHPLLVAGPPQCWAQQQRSAENQSQCLSPAYLASAPVQRPCPWLQTDILHEFTASEGAFGSDNYTLHVHLGSDKAIGHTSELGNAHKYRTGKHMPPSYLYCKGVWAAQAWNSGLQCSAHSPPCLTGGRRAQLCA